VVRVDLRLQRVAMIEEGAVARGHVADDGGEPRPEGVRLHARARQRLVHHEVVQNPRDLEPAHLDAIH
jgi:hypothetical protein